MVPGRSRGRTHRVEYAERVGRQRANSSLGSSGLGVGYSREATVASALVTHSTARLRRVGRVTSRTSASSVSRHGDCTFGPDDARASVATRRPRHRFIGAQLTLAGRIPTTQDSVASYTVADVATLTDHDSGYDNRRNEPFQRGRRRSCRGPAGPLARRRRGFPASGRRRRKARARGAPRREEVGNHGPTEPAAARRHV